MGMWLKTQEFFPCVFFFFFSDFILLIFGLCSDVCRWSRRMKKSLLDIFFLDLMLSIQADCSIYSTLFIYFFFLLGQHFEVFPKEERGLPVWIHLSWVASGYCTISLPASTSPTNLLNYKFHPDSYFICFVGCLPIAPKTAPSIE